MFPTISSRWWRGIEIQQSFHAFRFPVRDESETHLWQWSAVSKDPTAQALPKRLSFPEPWLHSWMAARQAPLAVKRAQHLYMLCNKPLSHIQWILLMRLQVARENTSMRDDGPHGSDHEFDNGQSLGIVSWSYWDTETFCSCAESSHYLRPSDLLLTQWLSIHD